MKRLLSERAVSTGLIISSALVVVVLAVLLYWWSNQVSEMTTVRLADSLQMSMVNWHLNLFRDLSDVCEALRGEPNGGDDPAHYAQRFREWKAATRYPNLVGHLYILKSRQAGAPSLVRLDSSERQFEPIEWDGKLNALWQALQKRASEGTAPTRDKAAGPRFNDFYPSGNVLPGWRFDPALPAVARPISFDPSHGIEDWLVIELNQQAIRNDLLPELARRYFSGVDGLDYMVAVVDGAASRQVIYSSDPGFATQDVADADGRMDVFGDATARAFGSPVYVFHKLAQSAGLAGLAASLGSSWFPLIETAPQANGWQLIVRHRRGGALGAFVAEMHRRDLAIGFGVLLLLVISVGMLILTSRRAHRLAKLQVEFVTAVSHELRSPLSIISSAAENIAEGVVETRDQVTQYGSVIERQTRRLSRLVEEILLFAATTEKRHRYTSIELEVSDIIDSALTATADLIEASQFTVELDTESNLPKVVGDRFALSQCLQNLITNALKYGGPARWIGVRARIEADPRTGEGKEIQISVSDRGIGIDESDLPHIFEPFYRSPSVTEAQIYGTGLGLSLAKSISESMNGRLTVMSSPAKGSTFTLHLPCAAGHKDALIMAHR